MEFLYSGELSLSVISTKTSIKGQFVSRPVAGAVDTKLPLLLKRVNNKKNYDLIGMAWLSIDFDCDLYYEVCLLFVVVTISFVVFPKSFKNY